MPTVKKQKQQSVSPSSDEDHKGRLKTACGFQDASHDIRQ